MWVSYKMISINAKNEPTINFKLMNRNIHSFETKKVNYNNFTFKSYYIFY